MASQDLAPRWVRVAACSLAVAMALFLFAFAGEEPWAVFGMLPLVLATIVGRQLWRERGSS